MDYAKTFVPAAFAAIVLIISFIVPAPEKPSDEAFKRASSWEDDEVLNVTSEWEQPFDITRLASTFGESNESIKKFKTARAFVDQTRQIKCYDMGLSCEVEQ